MSPKIIVVFLLYKPINQIIMKYLCVLFILISLHAFGQDSTQNKIICKKIWETDSVLKTPESVCFDNTKKILYVSNINRGQPDKAKNGFISILSLDGRVKILKWASGLKGPKGMAVYGKSLYITDINKLVLIDTRDGERVEKYTHDSAKSLNDVAIIGNEEKTIVFVSDPRQGTIFKLEDGEFIPWKKDKLLEGVNGLYVDNEKLLAGTRDRIVQIDPVSGALTDFILNTANIDGLKKVDDGIYIISDWTGNIHLVYPNKEKELLLSTANQGINAADFEYISAEKLLFIPTFFDNRVMGYTLK